MALLCVLLDTSSRYEVQYFSLSASVVSVLMLGFDVVADVTVKFTDVSNVTPRSVVKL